MKNKNFFQEIFEEEEFKERILDAKKIASETGLETGFAVGKRYTKGFYTNNENNYKISNVQISEDDNKLEGRNFIYGIAEGLFDSIDLHFHNRLYFPSSADLNFLNAIRKWDYKDNKIKSKPLMIVASYTSKKTNLFLIQEKTEELIVEEKLEKFNSMYENLILIPSYQNKKMVTAERTIDFFNFTDLYTCDMITFNDSQKISKKSLEKLTKFDDSLEVDEKFNDLLREKEKLSIEIHKNLR
tara:strand:+ start:1903 stop:2628 length:726 start_codon:yes stop_codon:yes gene_type:complete